MRWPSSRAPDPARLERPLESIDLDHLDALDSIELDVAGRLVRLPRWPEDAALREVGYAPCRGDGTGMAGIWEALARG